MDKGKQIMKNLVLSANTIIADNIANYDSVNLEQVKEIMLNTNTDKVAYVVVSYGFFRNRR